MRLCHILFFVTFCTFRELHSDNIMKKYKYFLLKPFLMKLQTILVYGKVIKM